MQKIDIAQFDRFFGRKALYFANRFTHSIEMRDLFRINFLQFWTLKMGLLRFLMQSHSAQVDACVKILTLGNI